MLAIHALLSCFRQTRRARACQIKSELKTVVSDASLCSWTYVVSCSSSFRRGHSTCARTALVSFENMERVHACVVMITCAHNAMLCINFKWQRSDTRRDWRQRPFLYTDCRNRPVSTETRLCVFVLVLFYFSSTFNFNVERHRSNVHEQYR